MAALVDTNVLVYRYDPRYPTKQESARALLRDGAAAGTVRVPHQAVVEFVAVVTKRPRGAAPLLEPDEAYREVRELLRTFEIVYPTSEVIRLALRGAAEYQLSWYDAHLWAYAEHFGLEVLYSEDFQHDRTYGRVRVVNPFA